MPADVSAPLPELDLAPLSVLTVDTGNAGRTITSLVIHGYQIADVSDEPAPDVS